MTACGAAERSDMPADPGEGKKTPATYSVEDFYKNTQFRRVVVVGRQKILVSSERSGSGTLRASGGGGPPQPLTQSTTNSIFALSYFPADERILYSSDEGGNELTHIYVRSADGSIRTSRRARS